MAQPSHEGGTPLLSTSVTASGQPIVLPQNNPKVRVPIYEIAPGAVALEYKHIYLRYGYVLAGTLRVTYTETREERRIWTRRFHR
jgi:quercetin dioxygenase-like cupin family protein